MTILGYDAYLPAVIDPAAVEHEPVQPALAETDSFVVPFTAYFRHWGRNVLQVECEIDGEVLADEDGPYFVERSLTILESGETFVFPVDGFNPWCAFIKDFLDQTKDRTKEADQYRADVENAIADAGWHRSPSGWKREPDVDAVNDFRHAAE